jgi:ribonuclease P protein component
VPGGQDHSLKLPRTARLNKAGDFATLNRSTYRITSQGLLVRATANHLDYARLGIAVAKRVVKQANERNRMKRVIRESFRHIQSDLAGLDILVVARAPHPDNAVLREALADHWRRVRHRLQSLLKSETQISSGGPARRAT